MSYVEAAVFSGTRVTDQLYTYRVPENAARVKVGQRVFLPFGRSNRRVEGLILRFVEEADLSIAPTRIKTLFLGNDKIGVTEEGIALARHMIVEDLADYASAFGAVLPPGGLGTYRPKLYAYVSLTDAGDSQPLRGARQEAVRTQLRASGEMLWQDLRDATGATQTVLRRLQELGCVRVREERVRRRPARTFPVYEKRVLNAQQQAVFDRVAQASGAETFLLCGVTGSGKTEIYLQLAQQALERGKEVLILVPEISLTPQTIARFQGRFGDQIAVLHSRLTPAERYEEWERIYYGAASIAIGARSAIFAPFQNLGLIVIDEEHEQSYYSEQNPKYHAHEIARLRSRWHQCPLVLGSATPSIETLYQAEKGALIRLDLKERVGKRPMPKAYLVDMREELKAGNRSLFSRKLQDALQATLANGEQSILFLNKRGHTSFVFCRKCGYVYRCDACDVAMTYHRHGNRLVCHYCGREKRIRSTCPQCGSDAVKAFGVGTERVEEEIARCFPQARVRRADADSMRRKDAYDALYRDMHAGKVDILVGTQMIAKGFDFPNVTLVGIVAADVTLRLPDFRAAERTFQLLTQVAGRAGRADKSGEVIVQSYQTDHYALRAALSGDVDAFYAEEIIRRRAQGVPPFAEELLIGISGRDRSACMKRCEQLQQALRQMREKVTEEAFTNSGPLPAVIERIDGRYRFLFLLRSKNGTLLRRIGSYLLDKVPSTRELRVTVTRNPRSIL